MEFVYLIRFFCKKPNTFCVLKIGRSKNVENRAISILREHFDESWFYEVIYTFSVNRSVAVSLENVMINTLKTMKIDPYIGREYYTINCEDVFQKAKSEVVSNVLSFMNNAKPINCRSDVIGARIRAYRKSKKITQLELAEKCGLRQATISDVENGKSGNFSTISNILNGLDLRFEIIEI